MDTYAIYDAVPCVRKLQGCSLWYVLVDINDRKRASWATNGALGYIRCPGRPGWSLRFCGRVGATNRTSSNYILVAYPWHPMTMGTLFHWWKSWQFSSIFTSTTSCHSSMGTTPSSDKSIYQADISLYRLIVRPHHIFVIFANVC